MLPVSGYASVSVHDELDAPMVMSDSGSKCHMPMGKDCSHCDMNDSDMDCNAACCTHCASHVVSLPAFFSSNVLPIHSGEIVTVFKHFYLHSTPPEQRPPLV